MYHTQGQSELQTRYSHEEKYATDLTGLAVGQPLQELITTGKWNRNPYEIVQPRLEAHNWTCAE